MDKYYIRLAAAGVKGHQGVLIDRRNATMLLDSSGR